MNQNFPNLDTFRQYMVTKLNEVEVVRQSLYDTLIYPTAGSLELLFFQTPRGQGLSASPGNATNVKALSDTNMELGGQLPSPQGYWMQSLEVDVQPGSSAAANTFALQIPGALVVAAASAVQAGSHDVNAVYSTGSLVLSIGQKNYLREAPLLRFPPKARFEYDAAVTTNSATVGEVVKEKLKVGGRPYIVEPGFALMTSQNFAVALQWIVLVATPSGFNAAIRTILDGWLFRGVQ